MTLLEQTLPQYDVSEIHSIQIRALPEVVYRAVQSIRLDDLAAARFLFSLRHLPARLMTPKQVVIGQWPQGQPLLQMLNRAGFVLVTEALNEEVVIGLVGKFWQPVQNQVKLADGAAFLRFDDPTYAKAAMNFQVVPGSDVGVRLITETRVRVPAPSSRRLFRLYWLLIGFFSGFIRVEMLKQIKRIAESAALRDLTEAQTSPDAVRV